jgi:hypothetical protein
MVLYGEAHGELQPIRSVVNGFSPTIIDNEPWALVSDRDVGLSLGFISLPLGLNVGSSSNDGSKDGSARCDSAENRYNFIMSALMNPLGSLCGAVLLFCGIFWRNDSSVVVAISTLGVFFLVLFLVNYIVQN